MILLRFLFGTAVVVAMFSLSSCSDQAEKEKHRTVVLPSNAVHEGWYFGAGERVVIDGTINGDAYVAGGTVEINGTVNGDLLVAGGQVLIGGTVSDDVRAAGGSVQIVGTVGRNVTAAGGSIVVSKSGSIGGGLLVTGGSLQHSGTVKKDAMLACGDMGITGGIEGNVTAAGRRLTIFPGAFVKGNVEVQVGKKEDADIASGTVGGTIQISTVKTEVEHQIAGISVFRFVFKILWIGGLFVTGLLFFVLCRPLYVRYGTLVHKTIGLSALWGFLALIAVPIVIVVLMITVVGIPVALLLVAAYLWLMYLSQLSMGLLGGNLLFKTEGRTEWKAFWGFALAIVVLQILTLIPVLGVVIEVAALLIGFGALVRMVDEARVKQVA